MDLSHIMLIELEEHIGPYRRELVVLFNEKQISEKEAVRLAKADEYNVNVLVIPKKQWVSLFLNGKEKRQ